MMNEQPLADGDDENEASGEQLLTQVLGDLFAAIGRIKSYAQQGRIGLEEPIRRDAVAHNFGLIAHGLLGLQDIAGFQKYENILSRWLTFSWEFTWKQPETIDWDALWEAIEHKVPELEADLSRIAAHDF